MGTKSKALLMCLMLAWYNAVTATTEGLYLTLRSDTARQINNFFSLPFVDIQHIVTDRVAFLPNVVLGLTKLAIGGICIVLAISLPQPLRRSLTKDGSNAARRETDLRDRIVRARADAERKIQAQAEAEQKRQAQLAAERARQGKAAAADRQKQLAQAAIEADAARRRQQQAFEANRQRQAKADAERRHQLDTERKRQAAAEARSAQGASTPQSNRDGGQPQKPAPPTLRQGPESPKHSFSGLLPGAVFSLREEMKRIGFDTIEDLFHTLGEIERGSKKLVDVARSFDRAQSSEFHRGVMLRLAYAASLALPKFEDSDIPRRAQLLYAILAKHGVTSSPFRDSDGGEVLDADGVLKATCVGVLRGVNSTYADSSGDLVRHLNSVIATYNLDYDYQNRTDNQQTICSAVLVVLMAAVSRPATHSVIIDSLTGRRNVRLGEHGHLAPHEIEHFLTQELYSWLYPRP